ncbi:hypothetical protein DLM45_01075 [Hyphomicrobium methylovorum]|uniref:hypothetical protein n=1 Tax=Hyphomicrobium methylovorum TaxID=84 RepID=UPI0015E64974|nr:hypothetical protein [Hyphomicrobium methylovorum]MBA2124817.1 hypothetical protein [Hyphomicrobium methylovorum]
MPIHFRTVRTSVLAMLGLIVVASGPALAADALDASKLPRVSGTKDVFASPATTIFTTSTPVADSAEGTRKALTEDGWQQYAPSSTAQANETMSLASFKKGAQGLSVYVTVAPAQNNATSVTYSFVNLINDLPFPPQATDIFYDDNVPRLTSVTPDAVEAVADYFRTQLIARGWSPWSKEQEAKAAAADVKTDKGSFAYYVQDNKKPLVLSLQRHDDGKTSVTLEAIPPELIVAKKAAPVEEPKPAPAPEKPDKIGDAMDALAADIMDQARRATAEALQGVKAPSPKPTPEKSESEPALTALAGNAAAIPLPANAEGIETDSGRLEFNTTSSVQQVAAFYRTEMKALGWSEQKSVINRSNMTVLGFRKGSDEVSLTILKMGSSVNVMGTGSVFKAANKTASGEAASGETPSTADQSNAADEPLVADEAGGLPVPKPNSLSGSESTPFRRGANASVRAKLAAVLDFYRSELGKRNWTEDTAKAVVTADRAELRYATPDGPAVLKLSRANGETIVSLAIREEAKAKASGFMPKPGQVTILFGNILDTPATITIAGKTVKVKAGAGKNGPDGPKLDVKPGTYSYSLKGAAGGDAEPVTVGADEIWGLMIGPGGVLALQMY